LRRAGTAGNLFAPDEEYLNIAITRLLPEYYGTDTDACTGAILRGLADRLIARHGDRWLADALKTPHSPAAAAAFAALGRAEEASGTWDFFAAGAEARKALPMFQSEGSAAGVMFARLEQVFALDWDYRGKECVEAASLLSPSLQSRSYARLEAQAILEEGSCATWMGDFEHADLRERVALEKALNEHYPVLHLRAAGLNASRYALIGNGAATWRENLKGLADYWAGSYPLLRAHQLYSNLLQFTLPSHSAYSAVAWARELASIDKILGNKNIYGPTLWQLGMAEIRAGLREDANRDLRQSVEIDPPLRSQVLPNILLAAVETTHGELDEALSRLLTVQAAADSGDNLLRLRFAVELGRVLLGRGEYYRSRKLFDEARRIGEDSWSHAPQVDRVLWSRAMASIYRGLVECEIGTGADPRQARALWSQYRARLFARGNAIAGAQDAVAHGEARLSFAELSSGVAVWLETDRGLDFRQIKSKESLYEAVGRLGRGCASETSPPLLVRAEAKDLSQQFLGSWDDQLNDVRTLIVETDGPVAQVPWLALVRQNGHYWSEDFAVKIHAGSSSSTAATLTSDSRALVVGAPAFSGQDGLAALQNAGAEAEKVSRLFPRYNLLTGRSAVLSEVRERLAQAQLFHFTGHGYGGEGGGLLLRGAEGGLAMLRAADIQDLDLSRCSLVVLAGCSTAAGERGGPGDPQSLVRGFLHAGAADVVAGLWNLDSDGTQMLVDKFYESLLSGSPVAESLRKAAAAVRSDSRYAQPYYWAGLEVFSSN
jgi:CHAT domain-containing protein